MKRLLYRLIVLAVVVATLLVATVSPASVLQPSAVYAAPDTLSLLPDGVGDYTNIASVDPLGTPHWDAVNDPVDSPDDLTTYLSTTSSEQQKDAFTLQDTSQTGTINSVTVYFRFCSSAANKTHYAQPFLRLNTTETTGTEQEHTAKTWTTYSQILARPGGGSWSWTDINNLQIAIGLRDADAGNPQLTQVYLEVDYTPPTITNSPDTYAFGTVAESSSTKTLLTYFTVTNDSSYAINIAIIATDMTGGAPWTLSDTATPAADVYGLRAGLQGDSEGDDYLVIVKKTSATLFISNLAPGASQEWGLQLLAPTEFSDGGAKSGTVTLIATPA